MGLLCWLAIKVTDVVFQYEPLFCKCPECRAMKSWRLNGQMCIMFEKAR